MTSRERFFLFQVERDLGERIARAGEQAKRVNQMTEKLTAFESELKKEGAYWKSL